MIALYNLGIWLYGFSIRIAGLFGNKKAQLFMRGRKAWRKVLKNQVQNINHPIWFHVSSLGEYEQAKPLIEQLGINNDILLSFFSPSGYEIVKKKNINEKICYLPLDTKRNATSFLNITQPKLVVLVKYDLWYHYINEAHKREIPQVVVSAVFNPNQIYFKWYGQFFLKILKKIKQFYVQDLESGKILEKHKIKQFIITGDTRIDSVIANTKETELNEKLSKALANKVVLIAGSSYEAEEELLEQLLTSQTWTDSIIIAPHKIAESRIASIKTRFPQNHTLYSKWDGSPSTLNQVLIIDNIGMLKQLYALANIALVGGGFGKTIHNTLEPAAFGLPILFGPHYSQFTEAVQMVKLGGAIPISNFEQFKKAIEKLCDPTTRKNMGSLNAEFILSNAQATDKVIKHLRMFTTKNGHSFLN